LNVIQKILIEEIKKVSSYIKLRANYRAINILTFSFCFALALISQFFRFLIINFSI